jgi:hypothetical protein
MADPLPVTLNLVDYGKERHIADKRGEQDFAGHTGSRKPCFPERH